MKLDDKFDQLKEHLYSAVIADILDDLGYRNQTMDHTVRPLLRDMVVVGRAYPVLAVDIYEVPDNPYDGLIESLDGIQPGDVYIVSLPSKRTAVWGELLSNAALVRGGRGAIVDGCIRDTKKIEELGFPVFSSGYLPRDSKGRNIILESRVPIECAGVKVYPGDLIFADYDGVVIVPNQIEDEVIAKALEKVSGENTVRDEVRKGASIKEIFDKFGIL
ncbi:RraA family protein [Bacillus sp. Marseille-P3661]|uniref:RraA family protein n=1 Tax=Bacillus sp. Marseille-P3661 TaxID=1936234 RepID=UPI000C814F20|nr:RraA family protein [Bacillus sp. Marseille-P3661]